MLEFRDVFEVDRGFMTSSLDEANGEFVKIKIIIDSEEKSRKGLYQIFELFIYFGWPMIFSSFVYYLFPQVGLIAVAVIFILMVFWPVVKGKIGVIIAPKRGIKDPRRAIRSSSFWCDGFMFIGSPLIREIRQHSALSRSLDCIYNISSRFGFEAANFKGMWWKKTSKIQFLNLLIKKWTFFWSKMPISQDVRTRLSLVSLEIERMVSSIYVTNKHNGLNKIIKIVLLAGGTQQDVIMATANLMKSMPDIKLEIVCVEPDGLFAIKRSKDLVNHYGLPQDVFTDIFERVYIDPESKRTLEAVLCSKGYQFEDFDLVVCVGLSDYMHGDKIFQFIRMLDNGKKIITANVSGNFIERVFMHIFLQWPKMQYLTVRKYKKILVKSLGIDRKITIYRTPNKVFNVAIVE